MAGKQMTAREELVDRVGKIKGITWKQEDDFAYLLSDYYISRKKPLKHKETPAERARRTTQPMFKEYEDVPNH